MSYVVLARKYRPRSFEEVLGQDVLTGVLQGAIKEGRIGHGYLFSGPRGTGKTTVARIFAKALNCEQGPAQDPCGTCERCQAADSGTEVDLVEIDAASNTGVDFIRDLRDQAAYVPMRARFKVYLIDEVHMLSKGAFNALLKTLEEPPPHVKFLFATTELHKVPDTILSRCQVLRLGALPETIIAKRLGQVFASEGVTAEEGVIEEIARRARGGMRDALSLADQLLALVGDKPQLEDLTRLSGEAAGDGLSTLLDRMREGDRAGMLEALPSSSGNASELLESLLDELRGAMLCSLLRGEVPMLDVDATTVERLRALGTGLGAERVELWLQELLVARERVARLPGHARTILEVTLLDLCRPETTLGIAEIEARLLGLEARLQAGGSPAKSVAVAPAAPQVTASEPKNTGSPVDRGDSGGEASAQLQTHTISPAPAPAPAPEPTAGTEEPQAASPEKRAPEKRAPRTTAGVRSSGMEAWKRFLAQMAESAPALGVLLERRGKLLEYEAGRAVIELSGLREQERVLVTDRRNQKACSRAFGNVVGEPIEVTLQDGAGTRPGKDDPYTQQVADLFGGRIEDEK
jgi:DNA polymerase-3 subunit gamma/tau